MDSMMVSMFRSMERQAIRNRYNEIYSHELAHKNAAGSLAGPIVIENNSQGVPVGGHVLIEMPRLDYKHPEETIAQADIVIKSAMAPADPSEQDYKVAAQAKDIKANAEQVAGKKRIDYYA